ncbi:ribonuclease Z [Pseudomonas hamedanensis]|uniref:Ribonuclease Z n=1 Tax=Pseudomonas hamedanensis TaxID=2745504 RepID=A0A9E6P364_9PSED|nr:ribonuclease Z [Pseudomonas hamedanensis]QXI18640.1 ribonuclease Z [Pseudomonas hamedanensis]
MDLLFLGTSAGVPTRQRNVSATALLEAAGRGWYLIDCGEGTQHQVLRTPLSLSELRAVFITHVHADHCLGLPGLLASAGMSGRTRPLDVILPAALHPWLRLSLAVTHSHLPFEIHLHAVETLGDWRHRNVQVTTVELSHRVPCHGYVFTETDPEPRLDVQRLAADGIERGPLWGQLAHGQDVEYAGRWLRAQDYLLSARPARRIIVCGDNDQPERLAEVAVGADVLVHEATFVQAAIDRTRASYGHSSAAAIAGFAETVGVRNLVLTHFSARYQANPALSPSIEDVRQEAAAHYHGRLILARDLQRYHLDRCGDLQPEVIERQPRDSR